MFSVDQLIELKKSVLNQRLTSTRHAGESEGERERMKQRKEAEESEMETESSRCAEESVMEGWEGSKSELIQEVSECMCDCVCV